MVDDVVLVALIGTLGTIIVAALGIFSGPIRAHFAHRRHLKRLRSTLYGELFIKLERLLKGYIFEFGVAITSKDSKYLKSTNKLEIGGLISFQTEIEAQAQYYQLPVEEFEALAVAYYRLRYVINAVHKFGSTSYDLKSAKEEYANLDWPLKLAIYFINQAFENNAHILKKIGKGNLLSHWRKLMHDYPEHLEAFGSPPSAMLVDEQLEKQARPYKQYVQDYERALDTRKPKRAETQQKKSEAEQKKRRLRERLRARVKLKKEA